MSGREPAAPIFHLSIPVDELDNAVQFYTGSLGGVAGRQGEGWADMALFGAQLTLHEQPGEVTRPMPRCRHFGATLPWGEWERLTDGLGQFVSEPRIDHRGTDREQAKAMIADPSGNLIELKAYRQPQSVLRSLAI